MSQPSPTYIRRIEQWLMSEVSLSSMNMSLTQKFRARIVYEAYNVWLTNKQIRPNDLIRRISAREYRIMLQRAKEGNAEAQQYVEALNIRPGVPRSMSEVSNDVYVLNWMVGRFSTSTSNIEKAKVIDASDWLISEGKNMGDRQAVRDGAKMKMELNHNFDERQNPAESMPSTDINITGDVTIIDSRRANLSDEQRKKLEKQFGLSTKEVQELREQEDGSYAVVDDDDDDTNDELSEHYIDKEK